MLTMAGVAGLAAGICMKVSPCSILATGDVRLDQFLSILLMAAGPALALIGALGCHGAVKDSRCLRLLFFIVALMATVVQVAGVAFVLGFPGEMTRLLGAKAVELIGQNKVLTLSVTGGVTALEALSMASSMALYSKRRN